VNYTVIISSFHAATHRGLQGQTPWRSSSTSLSYALGGRVAAGQFSKTLVPFSRPREKFDCAHSGAAVEAARQVVLARNFVLFLLGKNELHWGAAGDES
jgi:hypothetical protein